MQSEVEAVLRHTMWTLEELAAQVGISSRTLQRMKQGKGVSRLTAAAWERWKLENGELVEKAKKESEYVPFANETF